MSDKPVGADEIRAAIADMPAGDYETFAQNARDEDGKFFSTVRKKDWSAEFETGLYDEESELTADLYAAAVDIVVQL